MRNFLEVIIDSIKLYIGAIVAAVAVALFFVSIMYFGFKYGTTGFITVAVFGIPLYFWGKGIYDDYQERKRLKRLGLTNDKFKK